MVNLGDQILAFLFLAPILVKSRMGRTRLGNVDAENYAGKTITLGPRRPAPAVLHPGMIPSEYSMGVGEFFSVTVNETIGSHKGSETVWREWRSNRIPTL